MTNSQGGYSQRLGRILIRGSATVGERSTCMGRQNDRGYRRNIRIRFLLSGRIIACEFFQGRFDESVVLIAVATTIGLYPRTKAISKHLVRGRLGLIDQHHIDSFQAPTFSKLWWITGSIQHAREPVPQTEIAHGDDRILLR